MRLIGGLLVACLALGALRAAVQVLALALAVALLAAALLRPLQTMGCLTWLMCLGLAAQYPFVVLPTIIALCALGVWSKALAD